MARQRPLSIQTPRPSDSHTSPAVDLPVAENGAKLHRHIAAADAKKSGPAWLGGPPSCVFGGAESSNNMTNDIFTRGPPH